MKLMLALLCGVGLSGAVWAADITTLFPASNEITGWTTSAAVAVYDTHTVWGPYDGGAIPFVDNDMQYMGVQTYTNNGNEVQIQLYDQGSAANARIIYGIKKSEFATYETVAGLGDSARADKLSGMFTYTFEFLRGQYYATISCPNTEPLFTEAKKLTAAMDAKILGSSPVARAMNQTTWGKIKSFFIQ
jgi:hypothetical protein